MKYEVLKTKLKLTCCIGSGWLKNFKKLPKNGLQIKRNML
jgi:hypothetical protein